MCAQKYTFHSFIISFSIVITVQENLTITYGIDTQAYMQAPGCFRNMKTWNYCCKIKQLQYYLFKLDFIHLTELLPITEMEFKIYDVVLNTTDSKDPNSIFGALVAGELKILAASMNFQFQGDIDFAFGNFWFLEPQAYNDGLRFATPHSFPKTCFNTVLLERTYAVSDNPNYFLQPFSQQTWITGM